MATLTTTDRLHFEQTFRGNSRIASRLLGEDGAVWTPGASVSKVPHQPLLDSDRNTGCAIRMLEHFAVRPGCTLQGMRIALQLLTFESYSVHGAAPIFFSGWYMVKLSQLPDNFRQVFTETSGTGAGHRDVNADLPYGGDYTGPVFRNIFNDHFADHETWISSENSVATQAVLPEMIDTMEVVGDDDVDLTYDEMMYLITGFYPKNNNSINLTFQKGRGKMMSPQSFAQAGADSRLAVGGKFAAQHTHSYQKNLASAEPMFFMLVAGIWEEPNNNNIYSSLTGTKGSRARFKGNDNWGTATNSASNNVIDRGAPRAVDLLKNMNLWMIDPTVEDPIGDLGDRAFLNYWLNGDVVHDFDYDPILIQGTSDSSATVEEKEEKTLFDYTDPDNPTAGELKKQEGHRAFITHAKHWGGAATLQGFPD